MKIEKVVLGPLFTNSYILGTKKEVVVIDPAGEPEKIFEVLPTTNLVAIFLTHAHPDHLGALPTLKMNFTRQNFSFTEMTFFFLKDSSLCLNQMNF